MSAQSVVTRFAEKSYPVSGPITGGQLVYAAPLSSVDTLYVAGANALNVLGVAITDGNTAANESATDAVPADQTVTVGTHGEYYVTYAAAATVGQLLVAAAAGAVTPYTAGTSTLDEIVGRCTASTAASAVGPAYIGAF